MAQEKPNRPTIGQRLWLSFYRADFYAAQAGRVDVSTGVGRPTAQRALRAWLEGMSRSMKERFGPGLRESRHSAGVTQEEVAEIAGLSTNAVAMIERGERVPNVDTAARLCWALDLASGATAGEIGV